MVTLIVRLTAPLLHSPRVLAVRHPQPRRNSKHDEDSVLTLPSSSLSITLVVTKHYATFSHMPMNASTSVYLSAIRLLSSLVLFCFVLYVILLVSLLLQLLRSSFVCYGTCE